MTDQPAGEAKASASDDPESRSPSRSTSSSRPSHVPRPPRRRARLHRPHRPGRAARGGLRERRLHRLEAAGGDGGHRLHPRRGRRDRAPGLLRLQRRSRVGLGLAAPRAARTAPGRHGRRRRPGPAAVRAGRQRRDAAARRRPGLHRPDVDRAHARRRGRQGEGLPRLRQGRGAGRRADPALVHPRGPLDVAEVPDRRVLRHGPRGRRGRAALEHPHDGLQRPGAGLERARLRLPGLQLPPQRRGVRQLPADLRRDRPLPRQARGALARARS